MLNLPDSISFLFVLKVEISSLEDPVAFSKLDFIESNPKLSRMEELEGAEDIFFTVGFCS